ncbi:hypothetical protein M409DRAFT_54747 [Zasmidium cellare ATCC 36951]|uniref:Lactonase family protein n=1 Tax=Zasmidium cellare ATCC 36951 TaxID=1080233 RepID=A0A6A6CML3_ZASCE|nr:uncharacterized protein M409DRAFT_54747 [Zasmidium cellare ATCC 36951]KAF2166989.1 hypothetical protein M409DRAFT_54747 [Zasmidium cellare ATCC 36951]
MLNRWLLAVLGPVSAAATRLFIADYGGTLTAISLTARDDNYTATVIYTTQECAPNPGWLTIDPSESVLYCLGEGLGTDTQNGSTLSSFLINADGTLKRVKTDTTISGVANAVVYGNATTQQALAVAHYNGSAVSTWFLHGKGEFSLNQVFPFTMPHPGPVADRQNGPHPHETILDPTEQYLVVPDLGADLVRVFSWDQDTSDLTPLEPLKAAPGSGPRHGAFWNPYGLGCATGCPTYFYVVSELAGTVTGYEVTYKPNRGGLSFREVYKAPSYGILTEGKITLPSEVHVSPDSQYLVIANRNDSTFSIPQRNGSVVVSDSLTTFALQYDGTLLWHQTWPTGKPACRILHKAPSLIQSVSTGGSIPRHYSINSAGTLVAVGNQYDQNVAILLRDPSSGLVGKEVVKIELTGNVTCVVWDEETSVNTFGY